MEHAMKSAYKWIQKLMPIPLLCFSATILEARPKTDVVVLANGDHITGEIKKLERGKLSLNTDWMGTLQIEWQHIERLESEYFYEVVMSSGVKYFGSLKSSEDQNTIDVSSAYSTQTAEHLRVVQITPIEKTFLDRLDFAIDMGFNYTQANNSGEMNLSSNGRYRTEKYLAQADYTTLFKKQQDLDRTARNQLNLTFFRYLPNRWFINVLSSFLQSDELSLDLRSVVGGGAGRNLVQTNRIIFSAIGGAVVNRESYVGEPVHTTAEGLTGVQFQTFQFDNPEMDITTNFFAIPSFSDWGRVRLDFNTKVRIEIIKDLFWQLSLFDNYDSRPPEGARKNDFGINTGVGWSF